MRYLNKARVISAFHMCPLETLGLSTATQNEVTDLKKH